MNLPSVAIAESATCGNVAAEFGAVWGAGEYFKGGIVVYTPELKTKFLGVSDTTDHENCVLDMARGVADLFNSDVGIATSGYSTPYPPKKVKKAHIYYTIYDRKRDTVVEKGCVHNTEYLNRSEFQKKIAMMLHVKYMELFSHPF